MSKRKEKIHAATKGGAPLCGAKLDVVKSARWPRTYFWKNVTCPKCQAQLVYGWKENASI